MRGEWVGIVMVTPEVLDARFRFWEVEISTLQGRSRVLLFIFL